MGHSAELARSPVLTSFLFRFSALWLLELALRMDVCRLSALLVILYGTMCAVTSAMSIPASQLKESGVEVCIPRTVSDVDATVDAIRKSTRVWKCLVAASVLCQMRTRSRLRTCL